jgi:hypothetical protein
VASLRICTVLVCLGLCDVLRAELQWRERRLLLEPPAGAADATGEFVYVNRGSTPVQIVEVRSGCGCTVMAAEKSVVPPGETGKLRAVFHVGSQTGKKTVAVTVMTTEPEPRQYDLTIETEIKDFISLVPRLIYWKLGDEPAAKIFQVNLAANYRFLAAESSTQDFAVEVAGQAGGSVQLRVTTRDTWAKRNGTIKIKVAQDGQPPVEALAYVRIL